MSHWGPSHGVHASHAVHAHHGAVLAHHGAIVIHRRGIIEGVGGYDSVAVSGERRRKKILHGGRGLGRKLAVGSRGFPSLLGVAWRGGRWGGVVEGRLEVGGPEARPGQPVRSHARQVVTHGAAYQSTCGSFYHHYSVGALI